MKKAKQTAAVISIILLVGMYVFTLISAIFDRSETMALLKTSVYCSIVIPVFLYIFLLITKLIKDKGNKNIQNINAAAKDITDENNNISE